MSTQLYPKSLRSEEKKEEKHATQNDIIYANSALLPYLPVIQILKKKKSFLCHPVTLKTNRRILPALNIAGQESQINFSSCTKWIA
jgi:hypothetical protein